MVQNNRLRPIKPSIISKSLLIYFDRITSKKIQIIFGRIIARNRNNPAIIMELLIGLKMWKEKTNKKISKTLKMTLVLNNFKRNFINEP